MGSPAFKHQPWGLLARREIYAAAPFLNLSVERVRLPENGESPLVAVQPELLEETRHAFEDWLRLGGYVVEANQGCCSAHFFLVGDRAPQWRCSFRRSRGNEGGRAHTDWVSSGDPIW